MNKKSIIVASFVGLIVLLLIIFFIVIILAKNLTVDRIDMARIYPLSCAKEGENIGAAGLPSKCCGGLMEIWGDGGLGICSFCGDNFCDTNYGENKNNCAKDCEGANACINSFQDIKDSEKEVCCKGLKVIEIALYQQDCSITPNSLPITLKCMHCGDGRCEQGAYLENRCNCPADCANSRCGKEGETLGSEIDRCCEGLKPSALGEGGFGGMFECR